MRNPNFGSNELTDSYHSFLESLKGKIVTIYRGGPESKTGKLLDVKSDYVTLYAEDNNNSSNNGNSQDNDQDNNNDQSYVVYYQAKHVKSISENSLTNSTQGTQADEEDVDYLEADNLIGILALLVNETVQINQGGPESKKGVLLASNNDFLVLYTEDDGIVYFNIDHVKSISKYQDNNQDNVESEQEIVEYPEIIEATDFHSVFKYMAHKWVAVNRGGPEAMEGVLVENAGGHYTLVCNQEVLRIHPYHIRSISSGPKGSLKNNSQNDEDKDEQNSKNEKNDKNKNEENKKDKSKEQKNKKQKESEENLEESLVKSSNRESSDNIIKTIDYVWKIKR